MKVLAFEIGPPGVYKGGDHEFTVLDITQPALDLGNADLVILPARLTLNANSSLHDKATELLARRLLAASEAGKRICLLYAEDIAAQSFIGGRLLLRWSMKVEGSPTSLAHVYADEFEVYLREYGVPGYVFAQRPGPQVRQYPLAGPNDDAQRMSAFAVAEGGGFIYVVPGNIVPGSERPLLATLADSIQAHSSSVLRPTTAPIAESFAFTEERALREERKSKQAELDDLDARIAGYRARKDILFLRDHTLADRVPEWMSEYLGFGTRRTEEYKEDFWLVDDKDEDAVICEAKGLTQNVKRQHIRQLVLHRDERDLADDYPSLLVANTFADAETEEEKARQRISPRECSTAVKEHVLVVRTLDLLRLLDQVERGLVSPPDVWILLTTAVGWLKVEGDARDIVTA